MGGAYMVPGVSGGTVAFITGIYEELIHSIKAVDLNSFRLLFTFQLLGFWRKINGNFLICVLGGIVTGLLLLSKLMTYLLMHHPISLWSFFFGLIIMSSPLILRAVKKWHLFTILSFITGIVLAYRITLLAPVVIPTNLFIIFFCGAIVICAMFLPGISGAFILLLIGQYDALLTAIVELNIPVITVFLLGCLLGIVMFSRFLSWLLVHYHFQTLAVLSGVMIGSLNKVWPWKEVIAFRINLDGIQVPAFDKNIWPGQYLLVTGHDPQLFYAILFAAVGIFLVVAIEKMASFLKSKN